MFPPSIQSQLNNARNVLVAGTGGGFDFVCGLPLVLALEQRGINSHLANLSFTALNAVKEAKWHTKFLLEITAQSHGPDYFPEMWLARWLAASQRDDSIYCFVSTGAAPYAESYKALVELLDIDTVILVDGGVDSLLRGDEHSLGTPLWDALTISAVNSLDVPRKFLATTAFGAERWDKISHAQAFERIADLTQRDALLGVSTLLRSEPEGAAFIEAAEYVFANQDKRPSIVVSSMLAALRGEFGERSLNAFTESTPLWISPLMCLYWFFELDEVAHQKKFLRCLQDTQTLADAADRLRDWTDAQPSHPWVSIPI